ncbi:PAS fold-containing protein [Spirosoma endophyticum]|uniref:histidine kinase n=1 Tax=Spirosoma endophyticum TaxID=662367 RepID=A0A1I2HS92_9BACT|nr:PAS fold-containing protein [Spirosoma endophyticum]
MLTYWNRTREQVINKPLFEALPEARGQGYEELLNGVFRTGERFIAKELPVRLVRHEQLEQTYIDFVYEPFYEQDDRITGVTVVCTEVTQQVLARMALEESERNLRNMILKSPMAMCIYKGPQHVVETANERMIEFWGRPATDVMDKPMFEGLPEAKHQGYEALLDHVFTTGESYSAQGIPVNLPRPEGLKTIYINLLYVAYREADQSAGPGRISGVMAVAVEVTDQVLAQQQVEKSEASLRDLSAQLDQQVQQRTGQLNDSILDLQRSNDNLTQFAYIASHDLQEPLRKVQQFGDLLKNQYGPQLGEGLTYLERMQWAASRMSTLIRDLLTYSRITIQQESTQLVPLNEVLQTVLTELELRLQETGAVVVVGSLPTVSGDASQLGQLLQNLVGNAIKFCQPGAVPQIEIRAGQVAASDLPTGVKPTRSAQAYHCLEIVDQGVGFDEKYLDRIFQVFQRLHGKSEFGGTGIGLAICEKVVANHGGAITASSKPGQGATFRVYLPL